MTDLANDLDPDPDAGLPSLESPEGRAVSAVLGRRLEQLRDAAWMKPVLESALGQMVPFDPIVEGYEIDYCKIKPNRDINLVVHAHVRGDGDASPGSRRLSCMVFPSADACRLKLAEEDHEAIPPEARRRIRSAGYVRPFAVLDDPAMIVRVFPVDPLLPGLAPATDRERVLGLLRETLEACVDRGFEPLDLSYEILHYKPRRSCALHYTVDLRGPDGIEERRRLFGKAARDDRGERNFELLRIAWRAASGSGGTWHAARPVTYLPEWRLLLQEAVPGRDFRLVFSELTPDDASPAQLAEVGGHLRAIARALHSLQRGASIDGLPEKPFATLFAQQEKNLLYLRSVEPDLAAEVARLRDELREAERRTEPAPLVFSHGDFAHGNVLIADGGVGIIDFDKACLAEPAYDMAYFLTHLWSFGLRHPRRMGRVADLWCLLREAYLELAEDVTSRRLALYEALDFVAYVLRNFRKQSHQASWMHWARGQVEAAWERLDLARPG